MPEASSAPRRRSRPPPSGSPSMRSTRPLWAWAVRARLAARVEPPQPPVALVTAVTNPLRDGPSADSPSRWISQPPASGNCTTCSAPIETASRQISLVDSCPSTDPAPTSTTPARREGVPSARSRARSAPTMMSGADAHRRRAPSRSDTTSTSTAAAAANRMTASTSRVSAVMSTGHRRWPSFPRSMKGSIVRLHGARQCLVHNCG